MRIRPPLILWRMLLSDLLRQFALSTAVLVGVIAFAATLRPLAEGQLAPGDALRFMGYATLPMLQFAAPFAAAFAATMTYHRFGSDNESLAASSGGVGYPGILTPAIVLGLGLSLGMGALTFEIVPDFSRAMKRVVARDLTRTLIAGMQRGDSVDLDGMLIHADRTHHLEDDGGDIERFVLEGVVAVATDDDGAVQTDVTAERADIRLYPITTENDQAGTAVALRLFGGVGKQRGEGLVETGAMELHPWSIPDALSEDPDFYDYKGLQGLSDEPDAISGVARARRRLATTLATREIRGALQRNAAQLRRVNLEDELDQRIVLSTRGLEDRGGDFEVLPSERAGRIEVTRILQDGVVRRHLALRAFLTVEVSESLGACILSLELEDVVTPDAGDAGRDRLAWSRLRINPDRTGELLSMKSTELLAESSRAISEIDPTMSAEIEEIQAARTMLINRMERVRREITGVVNQRAALSSACMIMTLLGAVMGLRLHRSLPLPVYLWSFLPAMATVITISGGASAAKDSAAMGLAISWSAVGGLGFLTFFSFSRLRRH